ncbi:MAG: tellurite methyltransferase [Paracoccaceae bacterium]|jgi:tellurite methyltransferase
MAARISSDAETPVDWSSYYGKTGDRPPRPTLVRALDAFAAEGLPSGGRAVDLGCGSGRDTIEILRRGWPVLAVDAAPEAIEKLLARPDLPNGCAIETLVSRYEDMALPTCNLVNAAFSLPLCPAEEFPAVWQKIVTALASGGRFSGQFYGDRDSWVDRPGVTCLSRDQVVDLLEPFDVELLEEEEDDSVTPRGVQKHWHIFHIVARKR